MQNHQWTSIRIAEFLNLVILRYFQLGQNDACQRLLDKASLSKHVYEEKVKTDYYEKKMNQ